MTQTQKRTSLIRTYRGRLSYLWRRRLLLRVIVWVAVLFGLLVGGMFAVAQWYIGREGAKPYTMGVSFIPNYASSLGVEPQETFDALLSIGVKHYRLVSYWKDIEPTPGTYDFSQLDWQFKKAEASGAKVMLTLGLRQPRWPECHQPSWVDTTEPREKWQPQLVNFITATVNRYKNSPALDRYQLENEYFLKGFGTCTDHSRERLISEYNLVKQLDPKHQIVVARSNNALGFPIGDPTPDLWSISIYKRVWDAGVTNRYLEYPFPSWFYGYLAGVQQLVWGKNMIIAELQAEPWPPNGQEIRDTSLNEQNKSFNADRFDKRFEFAKDTGMREVYFWGAEYWYYRKAVLGQLDVWNVAADHFTPSN